MLGNDLVTDRKTEARSVCLGREERIKDPAEIVLRDPIPLVSNLDDYVRVFRRAASMISPPFCMA